MFKTYNLYSTDTEKIIRKVYYLRNLFHNGIYFRQLLYKFKNQFPEENSSTIEDLEYLLKKFDFLIIKILVCLLELNQTSFSDIY